MNKKVATVGINKDISQRNLSEQDIDSALQRFQMLRDECEGYIEEDLTESDTRSKLIDTLLIKVFGWREDFIRREPHVSETGGYIDYILSTSRPYYIIEAKRKDVSFSLPNQKNRHQYKIGGVLSKTSKEPLIKSRF